MERFWKKKIWALAGTLSACMRDGWERFIWALAHAGAFPSVERELDETCEEVEYGTTSFFLIVDYNYHDFCLFDNTQCFRRSSYSLVGKDGDVEYTPSPGIFHSGRNNLRRCFPGCTVGMQVFNVAEFNISVIRK
jgi:hypothetical protein